MKTAFSQIFISKQYYFFNSKDILALSMYVNFSMLTEMNIHFEQKFLKKLGKTWHIMIVIFETDLKINEIQF